MKWRLFLGSSFLTGIMLIEFLCLDECQPPGKEGDNVLSLSGEWAFRIDSLDRGLQEKWYNQEFNETVVLPGSMAQNGKGEEVSLKTAWTGDIVDSSYFTSDRYAKYRRPGNIKIPFWLKPVKYYKGPAWYQKEIRLPAKWRDKRVTLYLERCHWESAVFINGRQVGSRNSLATPHDYDITSFLTRGLNRISIRIDNRIIIPVGVNSHSISDHTQTNWNGIIGQICLKAFPEVSIGSIKVYPNVKEKNALVKIVLNNTLQSPFNGKLSLMAESFNSDKSQRGGIVTMNVVAPVDTHAVEMLYPFGDSIQTWNEFHPALYHLKVSLADEKGQSINELVVDFGMREFKTRGTRFEVNGLPIFLRGTVECCIFPLTGYPPTDVASWERVLQQCKDYGMNTIRFHSWCPPEAAFIAGDRLGFYFQVECSSWANQGTSIGDGLPVDKFIYEESDHILDAYGNHPSFCMLAYGNEPAGDKQDEFLGQLIRYWKARDSRRVYTSGAGWPLIPENDYHNCAEPRIQRWEEGLKSIINSQPPQTMFDYRNIIGTYSVPYVSHEIGQWCAYPDFKEIQDYTGVLKATNFEIFKESLDSNAMGDQAEDFLLASGKLQTLCYKADIEAAFRTPGFAGFHLLQLHDFPGQGTALVGVLNAFFDSKGYVSPEEFRHFCSQTVPLARMGKVVYSENETFKAEIELSHFGEKPLKNQEVICRIMDSDAGEVYHASFLASEIPIDNCIHLGTISFPLDKTPVPQKLILEVSIPGTQVLNTWDFWVYPQKVDLDYKNVLVTDKLDANAEETLRKGGSVLLLTYGRIKADKGPQVKIGFSSIFWNTAWTHGQPPHTLGILVNPDHPVFKHFPTEYHSNWQWWDPMAHSEVMILDGFPSALRPLIQPIDTWFENRRLALVFEASVSGGKLMVCSIDLGKDLNHRIVSRQLLYSMLEYMNNTAFQPKVELDFEKIWEILKN
jgi:hypothetical protein